MNNRYVIKATGPAGWKDCKAVEIGVSLGNPNHDGDKLRSILDWADKRFETCIVTLSDTLHRYTLMGGAMDEANAYFQTRKGGNEWIDSNRQSLDSLRNAKLVLDRWDNWLKHPDYEELYAALKNFRDSDAGLRQALEGDAEHYLSRRSNRGESFDYESAFRHSLEFFIEEIAAYILIGRAYGALRAYPARDMLCFRYMRSAGIPDHLKGLERAAHLELNFKKKIALEGGKSAQQAA